MLPDLYGIDPEVLYRWSPKQCREVLEEARIDEDGRFVPAVYGKAKPGALVILLSPLPERLSLRANAARTRYWKELAKARLSVERGGDVAAATELCEDAVMRIYSEDLQFDVLAASVKGWEVKRSDGTEIAFSGKWERDAMALPGWLKAELFSDIMADSALSQEEQAGFLSQQASL